MDTDEQTANRLRTVAQLANELHAFTEASLRRLSFHANHNGLATAILRIGRRIPIHLDRFNARVEQRRGRPNVQQIRVTLPSSPRAGTRHHR